VIRVYDDEWFMRQALQEAQKAAELQEVPVGAVISMGDRIIARAHNTTEQLCDVTAHAEILCITAASEYLASKYLKGCTLYVTLEPCVMCAGALFWSQIDRIVWGADDDKRGFMRVGRELLHPGTKLECGILQDACSSILKEFFLQRR
jgi:tRNA(adenine34) deaminase